MICREPKAVDMMTELHMELVLSGAEFIVSEHSISIETGDPDFYMTVYVGDRNHLAAGQMREATPHYFFVFHRVARALEELLAVYRTETNTAAAMKHIIQEIKRPKWGENF